MIIERREVEFGAEALISVLAGSPRAAAAFGLARGQPQAVIFESTRQAVRFVFPGGGHAHSVELDTPRLGALLVGFCLRMRMPLPRKAEKSIRVEPGAVVLAFRIASRPNMANLVPEEHRGEVAAASQRSWGDAAV
jgi:hypothetical protein